MNVDDLYPSKYLKASDLKGREALVKMSHVNVEQMQDGTDKPVLYFVGKEKGVVLNVTNKNAIAAVYGSESDDWSDQEIVLFGEMTSFQGKRQLGIRMRAPLPKDRKQPPKQDPISSGRPATAPMRDPAAMDDEIPFAPEVR